MSTNVETLLASAIERIGMRLQPSTSGVGHQYAGDGILSEGSFWFYGHANLFGVSLCDFRALQDCLLYMPAEKYLALRWHKTGHQSGGYLTSYLEENGQEAHAMLQAGTHISYTEVLYMAEYYENYLSDTLRTCAQHRLSSIIRTLVSNGQWSSGTLRVFREITEYSGSGPAAELYFQSEATKLMSLLLQSEQYTLQFDRADLLGLTTMIEYITDNLGDDLSLGKLACYSQMSASKLKNIFKAFTGKTISRFIKEKRMEKAEELLANTTLPVESIATLVGFKTSAGFATSFGKYNGSTPSAFRKLMCFHCNTDPSIVYERKEHPTGLSFHWGQ